MKLLFGLGNPGKQYGSTRHNVGFMVADAVASEVGIAVTKNKFSSFFGIGKIKDIDVCIVKPQTFMNLSGDAVVPFAGFYKVESSDILVVQDDIDMDLGKIKFTCRSGSGGHNGVASIIEKLGTNEFWRLKIGVGRPKDEVPPADHVLQSFAKTEKDIIEKVIKLSSSAVFDFFIDGPEKAMQKYHNTLVV